MALNNILRLANVKPGPERGQKYCRACGSLISTEAIYCPNCGAHQGGPEVTPEAATPRKGIAETIAKRKNIRLKLFFVSLTIFIVAFFLGSVASLTRKDAEAIVGEFQRTIGTNPSTTLILKNNLTLCLLFYVPIFGTAFMAFVGYGTGTVLSAVAVVSPDSPSALSLALVTLALPWAWMEFTAYSLASCEGIIIIISLIGHTLRREMKMLFIVLVVTIALLVLGAIIEAGAIRSVIGG